MIFTLPLPQTTNSAYATKGGQWYKTAKQKAWETEAGWKMKATYKGKPMKNPVSVCIDFWVKYDRDIDGGIKAILDLLQRQGVYVNDSQVKELRVCKLSDKEFPRAEVGVEEL